MRRASLPPSVSSLSPVVMYHELARSHLAPPGFLMRPLLNGGKRLSCYGGWEEMDSELIEEMRGLHRSHTVIVYGSRARGEETAESDVDVAGFADVHAMKRDARIWNGIYLDAFVYPTATLTKTPEPELLKLRNGRVLVDERGLAAGLFDALAALEAAGPPELPEGHVQMLRVWARKMLSRIQRGDVEAHYRRHWLLYQLLEDYFTLRGQWYRGPKLALAELQQHDPAAHTAFAQALVPNAPIDAIEALVDAVTVANAPPI